MHVENAVTVDAKSSTTARVWVAMSLWRLGPGLGLGGGPIEEGGVRWEEAQT